MDKLPAWNMTTVPFGSAKAGGSDKNAATARTRRNAETRLTNDVSMINSSFKKDLPRLHDGTLDELILLP